MSTPLMIQIALWYHSRVTDYGKGCGDLNFGAPAVQEEMRSFVSNGLLRRTDDPSRDTEYEATDRLRAWVDALCSVPWPEQKWVMPEGWARSLQSDEEPECTRAHWNGKT